MWPLVRPAVTGATGWFFRLWHLSLINNFNYMIVLVGVEVDIKKAMGRLKFVFKFKFHKLNKWCFFWYSGGGGGGGDFINVIMWWFTFNYPFPSIGYGHKKGYGGGKLLKTFSISSVTKKRRYFITFLIFLIFLIRWRR